MFAFGVHAFAFCGTGRGREVTVVFGGGNFSGK
jgi:hypothetical protein